MFNSNIKTYECKIQTLSPIHIGSGSRYSPSEFTPVKAKNKRGGEVPLIRRVNVDKYYSHLSGDKKDDYLENIIDQKNLGDFVSKISKEFGRYDVINKTSNESPKEVVEHVRTMDELFIPGSSLKGAIKTAILYNLIDYSNLKYVKRLFKNSRGKYIPRFENFLNSFFLSERGEKQAQFNISKFLQISDSSTIETSYIHKIVSIMGKNNAYDGFEFYRRGKNKVESFYETIPNKKILKSKISINYDSNIYRNLNLKNKEDLIDIETIKKNIYNFSNDLINFELEFLDKYSHATNDISKIAENLVKVHEKFKEINTEETPLLNIGSGSGFMAVTIGLKIKNLDESLFETIRKQLKGKNYPYEFPKSRKIIKEIGMPLGWVKLEFKKVNK